MARLDQTLRLAGVIPIPDEHVQTYKDRKVFRTLHMASILAHFRFTSRGGEWLSFWVGTAVVLLAAGLGALALLCLGYASAPPFFMCTVLIVAIATSSVYYTHMHDAANLWYWAKVDVHSNGTYEGFHGEETVPPFVQQLMHRVRTVVPDAVFSVLVFGYDPILVVTVPDTGESRTLLIWEGTDIIRFDRLD